MLNCAGTELRHWDPRLCVWVTEANLRTLAARHGVEVNTGRPKGVHKSRNRFILLREI